MLKSKYLIPFLFLLALLAACHYRPMYIPESGEEGDSARINTRAYALNSNFQVEAEGGYVMAPCTSVYGHRGIGARR